MEQNVEPKQFFIRKELFYFENRTAGSAFNPTKPEYRKTS
jgi:hypothetical protein